MMNEFVKYLNGLHNYYAQNQNAYGERNVKSPYYKEVLVPIDVCDYIIDSINNNSPHIIILTGHAGDGKTSIMFQVLEHFGKQLDPQMPRQNITVDNNKEICCIKDFSEFSDENKLKILTEVMEYPPTGKYVFMVANTGPLINTFGNLFTDSDDSEKAKMALIEAMDSNDGIVKDIFGYRMLVINVASIDNVGFAGKYLDKVIGEKLWQPCQECSKKASCHILRNHNLIKENMARVCEFIENFYIWQTEYGTRLTIRSIAEHLAYMITGGYDCENIIADEDYQFKRNPHEMLFSNLFFGYEGIISNPLANNIFAVRKAKESGIFLRRIRADEELLIRRNYQQLFGRDVIDLIEKVDNKIKIRKDFDDELRRMYLFMNIASSEQHQKDIEDIFSKQFIPYLSVRNKSATPTKNQKNLVIDALRMIYLGTVISTNNMIPITMGTEVGIMQSVQMIAGELNTGDIELMSKDDSALNKKRKNLILKIKKKEVCHLTLPMVNHFEELKNGVIATNIDPQLSRGIENIKSKLLELADTDDDQLDFLVMDNKGFTEESITIENGKIVLQ